MGRFHWSAYPGSDGVAPASRLWSRSTSATFGSARSASTTACSESAGTSIVCIEMAATEPSSFAPAAAISELWSEALVPWAKVTMYGTGDPVCEEEVVVEGEEEVSVEVVPVSAAPEGLAAEVPVSVAPVDVRPSGETPPNAPDTKGPA